MATVIACVTSVQVVDLMYSRHLFLLSTIVITVVLFPSNCIDSINSFDRIGYINSMVCIDCMDWIDSIDCIDSMGCINSMDCILSMG